MLPVRVLVVDDDPVIRDVVRAVLDDEVTTTTEAHDGADALRSALAAPPDVVVLDVMMPGMDGFEVARRLRGDARTRSARIVILSALDSAGAMDEARRAGADAYLVKPFSALELLAATGGTHAAR